MHKIHNNYTKQTETDRGVHVMNPLDWLEYNIYEMFLECVKDWGYDGDMLNIVLTQILLMYVHIFNYS